MSGDASRRPRVRRRGNLTNLWSSKWDPSRTPRDGIPRLIKIVDEIGFQTNILTLNTAEVAGTIREGGMGFAVIAAEVRTLVQGSARAAK